jgi:hypothetical protein
METDTYQNVKIEKDSSTATYQTRFAVAQSSATVQRDPIKQTHDNILMLLTRLEKDLRAEVFNKTTVQLIERIRFVTDIKSLAKEVKQKGGVIVSAIKCKLFVENIRAITSSLDEIPDEELGQNYKAFVRKLEKYIETKELKNITSMSILRDFFKTELKLFEGIELVMHAMACASVKISVESVVESLVSRYETHFNKNRSLDEDNAMDEMMVAENGPTIFKANSVLFAAMNDYWKSSSKAGKWHFVRDSSSNIKDYGSMYGKTTMRLMKQPSKFPIMD